jgi:hypothetical protein
MVRTRHVADAGSPFTSTCIALHRTRCEVSRDLYQPTYPKNRGSAKVNHGTKAMISKLINNMMT